MRFRTILKLTFFLQVFLALALLVAAGTCVSCGRSETVAAPSQVATMQAIHEYGRGHQKTPPAFSNSSVNKTSVNDLEAAGAYVARISQLLGSRAYGQLDSEARQVRAGRDRLAGGGWKLNTLYAAVSAPSNETDSEGDAWRAHISELKNWVTNDPQCATARVALANTLMDWAFEARGGGYANTVSQEGWNLFEERVGMAKATLIEAARLEEKCPGWFFVMQNIARAEAWSRSDERELFDQAISFEPGYYYFYQSHAQFLLPKWYGAEGETQAFINDVTAGVPEPDGSMLYLNSPTPWPVSATQIVTR